MLNKLRKSIVPVVKGFAYQEISKAGRPWDNWVRQYQFDNETPGVIRLVNEQQIYGSDGRCVDHRNRPLPKKTINSPITITASVAGARNWLRSKLGREVKPRVDIVVHGRNKTSEELANLMANAIRRDHGIEPNVKTRLI